MEKIKFILIVINILFFVYSMVNKKISTLIALPAMGMLTAIIGSIGVLPNLGLFDTVLDGQNVKGIYSAVVGDGVKMLASAISAAVFGAAFAKLLNKVGIGEKIIKTSAELAGERPVAIGISFFIATVVIFSAIGGLGAVILIGSIALPIMLTTGIKEEICGSIVLLGMSVGGTLNASNYAFFASILAPTMGNDYNLAMTTIVKMAVPIFFICFISSILFVTFSVKEKKFVRTWKVENIKENREISLLTMVSPLVPVVLIIVSTFLKKSIPVEIAILIGMVWLLISDKTPRKLQQISSSFIEGTKDVAGAIVLLMGLGILIKGFQYTTVVPIIQPFILILVSFLKNPLTYIIGFTLGTPLVLYRGPLNTFGIGGALPVIFATAGFSPMAIVWALYSVGITQGFADPTNSQNIWIADFLQIDPIEITKKILWLGIGFTFLILSYVILVLKISLI